jgi:hypothetical protein
MAVVPDGATGGSWAALPANPVVTVLAIPTQAA